MSKIIKEQYEIKYQSLQTEKWYSTCEIFPDLDIAKKFKDMLDAKNKFDNRNISYKIFKITTIEKEIK